MGSAPEGSGKLTWNGTYCMAVGGMVGGGIFSVLGIVVASAGPWAWAAFLLAGVIALLASLNYVALTTRWHQGAGSYGYLRRLHHERLAGMLAWVLVAGYVLTVSVYAFTFGHYLSTVLDLGTTL
jgi:amino acid transporter